MSSLRLERFRAILVGTKIPENIGSFARLLENFAVKEAALVSPQCEWREGVSQWMATGTSRERLNGLPVHDQLADAIQDCNYVVGFTARAGKNRRTSIKLEELAHKLPGKVALVFGREDFCLLAPEIDQCTHLCALDTSTDFPALNLSHSVAVVLSQIFNQENPSRRGHSKLVTTSEMEPMIEHLRMMMIEVGLNQEGNPERMLVRLRKIFQRSELNKQDLALLRGLYSGVISEMKRLKKN